MLRSYAIAPNTIRRMLWWSLGRFQLIVTLSFLIFGLYLAWIARPVNWGFAGFIVGVIALAYFFIIFFSYRQQLRMLYSARYELDGTTILFRQHGSSPLKILRDEISQVEAQRLGLWVQTNGSHASLLIPYGLARNGDEDFYTTLNAWSPVLQNKKSRNIPRWLPGIGLVAGALVLLFANTLWLTIPLGMLIMAYGGITERRWTHQNELPPGTNRLYSLAFGFLGLVILMKSFLIGLSH